MKIGRVTLSDRASSGVYEDRSGPEIERVLAEQGIGEVEWVRVVIPDDRGTIETELRRRWREALHLIHENGVSYNVYGDERGMERPWSLSPVPVLVARRRPAWPRTRRRGPA